MFLFKLVEIKYSKRNNASTLIHFPLSFYRKCAFKLARIQKQTNSPTFNKAVKMSQLVSISEGGTLHSFLALYVHSGMIQAVG
jgi:hypothetical protein